MAMDQRSPGLHIQIASDIHLEFAQDDDVPSLHDVLTPSAPVLGLLGDIGVLGRGQANVDRYRRFLSEASAHFEHVVVLAGNHEFYSDPHSDGGRQLHSELLDRIRSICAEIGKVHFLDWDSPPLVLDGVRVVGGTMWGFVPVEAQLDQAGAESVEYKLSDYRHIFMPPDASGARNRLLTATDTNGWHAATRDAIVAAARESGAAHQPVLVLTHHAPTFLLPHEHAQGPLRWALASDALAGMPADAAAAIHTWAFGHLHAPMDLRLGNTRVVANPRGYPNEVDCRAEFGRATVLFVPSAWTEIDARPSDTWPSVPGLQPPSAEVVQRHAAAQQGALPPPRQALHAAGGTPVAGEARTAPPATRVAAGQRPKRCCVQ